MVTAASNAYDPVQATLDALHAAGKKVEHRGGGHHMAQCPAHPDRTPSLSISRGDQGQALLNCFAGCQTGEVLLELGLPSAALFADYDATRGGTVTPLHTVRAWKPQEQQDAPEPPREYRTEKVAHFDYVWPDGSPCARVVKYHQFDKQTGDYAGKTFKQQRWDDEFSTYLARIGDLRIPVYRADLVAAAVVMGMPIYICEGEKDADAAKAAFKVVATTNPGGAKKWREHHTESLRGASEVVIVSDNDKAGREHAEMVRAALEPVVGRVVVKAAVMGKDISDHIAAGYGLDDLVDPFEITAEVGEEPPADPDWWEERPWLQHIHTFARSRMVSPYALLSVTLVRVTANVPPWVTLPAIIGGKGSLNLFCALVGPSGAGKSAVCAASDELLPWADPWSHVGSGEGLIHTYAARVQSDDPDNPGRRRWIVEQHTTRATGIVDEIDTLTALGARQGSTLLPTLRSAWSGSSLGFGYADPSKRLKLEAHSYRLGLVVGAQPTRCEALFDEADAGTPQRFIWAPLIDPDAPDDLPDNPGPIAAQTSWTGYGRQMTVPQVLIDAVTSARRVALRTGDTRGLDGHALLNRVKVSAAVALMEGRTDITEDDWRLAGRIQAVSDNTRQWVQNVISRQRETDAEKRAKGKAREAVVVDATVTDARIGRIARVITRAVIAAGTAGLPAGKASTKVASRDRDDFEAALHFALAAGWVAQTERIHAQNGEPVTVLTVGKEPLR